MHLAIPFTTLLMGSYVVAAPSIQHAQINVEIANIPDAYDDKVDGALHYSQEPLVAAVEKHGLKSLPFNFTLHARVAHGPGNLPFGFEKPNDHNGFVRGELGFRTEFAFRNGKLINGNRALSYHPARIFPPWISLSPLKNEGPAHSFPELIAVPQHPGGKYNFFLEFERNDLSFGALAIIHGQPVFVDPSSQFHPNRLILTVEAIRKSSDDDTDAEAEEELL